MPKVVTTQKNLSFALIKTCFAGAIASLITQPLEVIKTNMINSPSLYYRELHNVIITKGWSQYMRGGSVAVTRQAFGFALYTHLLQSFESKITKKFPNLNKISKYSVSSVVAKLSAMIFQAPLTLLKTRLEVVNSGTIYEECKKIAKSPLQQYTKGLGSSIAREGFYTLFHYNTYRLLKDDVLLAKYGIESTFVPAFFAGLVAITVSQPFEVIRSKISLSKSRVSIIYFIKKTLKNQGWKGFFIGYLPRLLRKPINSGICWTVLESVKKN